MNAQSIRDNFKNKERIVIKIGSSSLYYEETGNMNFQKVEKLVRIICDLQNQGREVVLVTSGAIAAGRKALGLSKAPAKLPEKQACAAVGQARLMMIYQKIFNEYNHVAGQVLMTKHTITNNLERKNTQNTFMELLRMGVVPIVNENDTVSTSEIKMGDNDTLSAVVASTIGADLLILLSDIEGLYTDDPNTNPEAKFVEYVDVIDDKLMSMGKASTGSDVGTGGMATKLNAAVIATYSGADMVITKGDDVDNILRIINGENVGTLFSANKKENFYIDEYLLEH
ncbi:MAG: glutamate 5-kinase [Lachnospiraceae bacterium]|nr:glutamate 5-kinase [Lachnospiraceae bacterium]